MDRPTQVVGSRRNRSGSPTPTRHRRGGGAGRRGRDRGDHQEATAAEAGYATASIDRLGNGDSTHPISAAVTVDSNATALHQVVQALRAGEIEGPEGTSPAFDDVALVGHSYGSITSSFAASRYGGADALVLTVSRTTSARSRRRRTSS
ncbi:MAG: alpha/beta hydrolase [Pseudonocardia sp.]|nr:alpha/beta hydrolase [Pseudonocardia sp.]